MSKFQTKTGFSIILFVILFFVLTNAVSINLKKRQDFSSFFGQGHNCTDENDDLKCITLICRIKGEDTHKCQISDERDVGETCLSDEACKAGLVCDTVDTCQHSL
ncbi:hypothetical protein C2G38_2228105 [Gigaspora rosea]|uniref:Uncharacterized protein n=1 Tax=Gigaspora rosea TaxID=44941 RepID=A0A397TWR6_9GLOM|nr:hypothetical protein C2G38_2228105 [Gigaspora rosea]